MKYILLDVDGTLMDTRDVFYESLNSALRHYGFSESHNTNLYGMSVEQALTSLGLAGNQKIKDFWNAEFGRLCATVDFFPGIEEMMRTLFERDVASIIITSRNHVSADPICQESRLSSYIAGCVAAEDSSKHKPDPSPLLVALQRYEVAPEDTLYIGDTFQDYQAAQAAHVLFGFAAWNKNAENKDYTLVFQTPIDVIAFVGGKLHE